jgi:hypothetical protein
MKPLAQFLGSSTRASVLEALAFAQRPMTAFRVSKMYKMNIAKVYLEMKRLADLGLVISSRGKRGLEYSLRDKTLRPLVLKLSPRVISFVSWASPEARAQRFRSGMMKIPKFSLGKTERERPLFDMKPTRMREELDTLARLARSNFDKKYRRVGPREFARV